MGKSKKKNHLRTSCADLTLLHSQSSVLAGVSFGSRDSDSANRC